MDVIFKFYNRSKALNIFVLVAVFLLFSCKKVEKKPVENSDKHTFSFVDVNATKSTKNLYKKLHFISKKGFAVGHQDATSYGLGWRYTNTSEKIKSDVQKVVGNFPAVYGFDIGHLELGNENNLDNVPFNLMKELIVDAYKKGGIITISWHLDNPVSNGNSWDKTPAVAEILEGGSQRDKYELWINRVADFVKSLQYNGEAIPIIFRPFHEMNGSWFWWGDPNCSASNYIKLWQQTVKLLRDNHNLHNILYAYSPNKLNPDDDYMKYYPGDEYVDILGIDIYDFNNAEDYVKSVIHDLQLVKKIASEKNKLYAFTETGLEKLQTPNWFTEVLYPAIENSGISWILLWRNDREEHHYMPYEGHKSVGDFKKFEALPKTLFLNDINNLKN